MVEGLLPRMGRSPPGSVRTAVEPSCDRAVHRRCVEQRSGNYDGGDRQGARTYDFPTKSRDPDGQTWDQPHIIGLFDTLTRRPKSGYTPGAVGSRTMTLGCRAAISAANSAHTHSRSSGMPTLFPLQSSSLRSTACLRISVRGLRNITTGTALSQPRLEHQQRGEKSLEIIADGARSDERPVSHSGLHDRDGRAGALQLGTIPEQPEQILMRIANDRESNDYNSGQREGKYYYAATAADVGPAFQALQHQIIRLTK